MHKLALRHHTGLFEESSSKSYIILAVYSGMLACCYNKLVQYGSCRNTLPYTLTAVGTCIAIILRWSNLIPIKMTLAGTKPDKLINTYFESGNIKIKQVDEMLIARIKDQD